MRVGINCNHTDKQSRLQQDGQLCQVKPHIVMCLTSSSVYRYRWTVLLKFLDPWNIQYLFLLSDVQTGRMFDMI